MVTSTLARAGAAAVALLAAACLADPPAVIVAHRSQGLADGVPGENQPENVPRAFAAGFGAEIDVRGDGARPFELGHMAPNGRDLGEVFAAVRAAWDPSFAGRVLVLDISDDEGDAVSGGLVDLVRREIAGTEQAALEIVIQSSSRETLARLAALRDEQAPELHIRLAMTYWYSPEYTTPAWIDVLAANVGELGEMRYPRPLLLFGAESAAALRDALTTRSEVFGLVTDHPRRAARW